MAESNIDAVEELAPGIDLKSCDWYMPEIKEIAEPTRKLLEEYGGIPSNEVLSHVQKVVSMPILIH
jgi:hypothetical protein